MQSLKRLIPLAGLLLACGCATLKPRPADPGLFLLKPADAGFSRTLKQSIRVDKNGTSVEAMAVVEISPEAVKLVALSPLGNRMLSLVWDGKKLVQERDPSLPKDFPAQLILRDLQLAYWSEASIREALPKNWILKANAQERMLYRDATPVIAIHFAGDPFKDSISFEHLTLGYSLVIHQLEQDHE